MSINMAEKEECKSLSNQESQSDKFIDDFIICPICERDLEDPRLLPCLHSYCKRCLERYSKENNGQIICMVCKETGGNEMLTAFHLSDLKTNTFVSHVRKIIALNGSRPSLDKIAKELKQYSCTSCPKKKQAIQRCEECRDLLCKTCVKVHKSLKILREHKLVDLKEEFSSRHANMAVSTGESVIESNCSIHSDEVLNMFCEICCELVCVDCVELGHNTAQHKVHDIQEAASHKKQHIEQILTDTKQTAAKFRGAWEILENTRKELTKEGTRLREEVKLAISNEKDKMNEREREYIDKIEDTEKRNGEEIDKYADKIEVKLEHFSNAFDFTESLLDVGDDMQLLNLCSTLENRLQVLKKTQPVLPKQIDDLSYIDLGEETQEDGPPVEPEQVDEKGVVSWRVESTIGSRGSGNGQFDWCRGVCSSFDGHVAVADWGNDRAQVFDKDGKFLCFLNSNNSEAGRLSMPQDVACLKDGRFVAVDKSNSVRVYDPEGVLYLSFQTASDSEIKDTGVELACVTVDRRNRILVGDCKRNLISIHYSDGKHIKTIQAVGPAHLATDNKDRIIVSCPRKQKVRIMSPEGKLLFHIDTYGEDREKLKPQGVSCDENDNIYIVHKERGGLKSVHMYNNNGEYVTCISEGGFREPYDVTVTPNGRVVVSDEDTIKVFWKEVLEE